MDSSEVFADCSKLPGIVDDFSFDDLTADEMENFF